MLVLLPPSETKRVGGNDRFDETMLAHTKPLGHPRQIVRGALVEVSREEATAVKALKLGKKNRHEREYNLELATSPAMPAIERYTGVLYDALEVDDLTVEAREWVAKHVAIQSALFGLIGAENGIPAYRLSASSRLPAIGKPLARVWADPHRNLYAGRPYVLDLRSKDYGALAPREILGAQSGSYVEVVARSDEGEVRALNHFNKAAKGELLKLLAMTRPTIRSREEFLAWGEETGLEISVGDDLETLRLFAEQRVPALGR